MSETTTKRTSARLTDADADIENDREDENDLEEKEGKYAVSAGDAFQAEPAVQTSKMTLVNVLTIYISRRQQTEMRWAEGRAYQQPNEREE